MIVASCLHVCQENAKEKLNTSRNLPENPHGYVDDSEISALIQSFPKRETLREFIGSIKSIVLLLGNDSFLLKGTKSHAYRASNRINAVVSITKIKKNQENQNDDPQMARKFLYKHW